MSRIIIPSIFMIWMVWTGANQPHGRLERFSIFVFLGGMALIVLLLGLWSRVLARRVTEHPLETSLERFSRSLFIVRCLIPLWFAAGVFLLGWGNAVSRLVWHAGQTPLILPGTLIGTLPAFLAWLGVGWAQYPADRALREQSMLVQIDEALPVHQPPSLFAHLASSLRMMLFTGVPVLAIFFLRDVATLGFIFAGYGLPPSNGQPGHHLPVWLDATAMLASVLTVFIIAPELLRRVVRTHTMRPSLLRERLEHMCRRSGLRYRDILVWRTNNAMGNAVVMGVVPRFRYILLSDVLLEQMSDDQIEGVFAHEIGHVIHRHIIWFFVFGMTLVILSTLVPEGLRHVVPYLSERWQNTIDTAISCITLGGGVLMFGVLSRAFERQADVYAARTIQVNDGASVGDLGDLSPRNVGVLKESLPSEPTSFVGHYGASLFGAVLHRVATINNIPVAAPDFFHGSIARRVSYLQELSGDPRRTGRFDRVMNIVYASLLILFITGSAVLAVALIAEQQQARPAVEPTSVSSVQ